MTFRDRAFATAAILLTAFAGFAQSPRITRDIAASSARSTLPGTISAKARVANDLGELPDNVTLHSVSLRFSLTAHQQAKLTQLLNDQQNPASARYHRWLTPEQYATRFGLAPSDLTRVSNYLASQGLVVDRVARSRSFLTFSGTAGQLKAALGASLHTMQLAGETHYANLTNPTLPTLLANVTSGITGLNDFHLKPRVRAASISAPAYTTSAGVHYLAPGDLYTIYDINPLLTSAINGSGITIAVLGQTDIPLTSAAAFRAASGLAANLPVVTLYGADPGTSVGDLPEALLDVEWAGAIAPAATILYVNSTDVIAGSLTNAVDDNLAPILSISYGDCEQDFGASNIALYNQVFRQANAQGQTIVGPAGDTGATDCDYNATIATRGLAVDFPASAPNVTGVGGTMFNEGAGTYFSATNGPNAGSALTYIPEVAWNETAAYGALAGGGGGASAYYTKPAFQTGPGVPNDYSRDVPDLSLASAALHDGYLICLPGYCTNGYLSASGALSLIGGTSVAVPEFAGMLALLEQKIQARVGNANPTIYGLANSSYAPAVFHDITTGNNAMPCAPGSAGCPSGGSLGYNTGVGYDLATGWGTVDATNFVSDWSLVTPTGTGGMNGTVSTSVLLLDSAATVTAGGTITFSATVSSARANAGPATPSGTLQFLVDNVVTGSALPVSSTPTLYAFSSAGMTPGTHLVTAAYSGDSTYLGSKATVQITVLASTLVDFALSPATSTVTTMTGTNAPAIAFTVASLNGFSGPVSFSATTTSSTLSTNGAYSFSPAQVALTSGGAAGTILTLSAFHSASLTGAGNPLRWSGFTFAGLVFVSLSAVRRRRLTGLHLIALAVLAATLSVTGCASKATGTSSTTAPINTPAGTYTVLVTATGTSSTGVVTSHNAAVTFVVL